MSSITFESSLSSCPMLLDSNKGNTTCASVANPMMYNNNGIFTASNQNSMPLYSNMACSTGGDSSTTSSVSSSHTRLQQFENPDLAVNDMVFNPSMPIDQFKQEDDCDLQPMTRDRSNTWPLKRPIFEPAQTSPLVHDPIIEEEDSLYGSSDQLDGLQNHSASFSSRKPYNNNQISVKEEGDFPSDLSPTDNEPNSESAKRSQTRRNAWGNMSYADLITQAILSSPEQRLTLSQVYEYMVANVPYFSNKGDSNSSAGWKWTINPSAKPGRNPRRRANTLESTSKAAIDKKRRGARKRVEMNNSLRNSTQALDSVTGSQLSLASDFYNDGEDSLGANFETFRARTQSNVSMPGNSSPNQFEDFEYPPWVNQGNASLGSQLGPITSHVNELLDRTDQMRLDNGEKDPLQQQQSPIQVTLHQIKQEDIKQESIILQQPPSYQDVLQNQGMRPMINTQIQQPIMQNKMMPANSNGQPPFYQSNVYSSMPSNQIINQRPINGQPPMNNPTSLGSQTPISQPQNWIPMQQPQQTQIIYAQQPFNNGTPIPANGPTTMIIGNGRIAPMGQQLPPINDLGLGQDLPTDLVSITNLDSRFFGDTDVDAIMRTL
ncbi:(pine wood nematode) hypothetical protein [Aphelenchoides bicaudatus]|nr:(pine wood nematode) hypothetical protein [Aphelenchoides bicaudatus]